MKGYKAAKSNTEEYLSNQRSLLTQCQAVVDMKFSYVVSCQQYGHQKRTGDVHAHDILRLMTTYGLSFLFWFNVKNVIVFINLIFMIRYPSLRVAYIDEVEETSDEKMKKVVDRVSYYSVLVKAVPKSGDSSDPVQNQDQVHGPLFY